VLQNAARGLAVAIATCGGSFAQAQSQLTIALASQPPTLDLQITNTNTVRNVAAGINEGLFALDATYKPHAVLAERYTRSDDGLTYTFTLRKGVMFHNGAEMTSADVAASVDRWTKRSQFGRTLGPFVDSISATDKYTVVMKLKQPINFVLEALSAWPGGAFIYPASVIEATGKGNISNYIGTGPFKFVSWQQGQDIVLQKFDGYKPVDEPANGYAGARKALVDRLRFVFVPESSVAVLGVVTGQYDAAFDVDSASRDQAAKNPNVVVYRGTPRMATMTLNKAPGQVMANVTMRRAVQAAICTKEIMPAFVGNETWRADPGLMWKESAWWSDVGKELYNICDAEKARSLAKQAGYDGKPIIIELTSSHTGELNYAQVLQQLLQDAGMTVQLKVEEAAAEDVTLSQKTGWDITLLGGIYRTHPMQLSHVQPDNIGSWDSKERDQLLAQFLTAPADKQMAAWEQFQALEYREVPMIKVGDFFENDVMSKRVTGYQNLPEPFFWNIGISK
jgi:peptide/nickel transport system substrate-binding protein